MKTTLLKISFIFLFLSLIGAGCEKDEELLWEISPDSETSVIQKEVDGIEFKFCLLNENGEPTSVFNEGENFTFQFSFKNNTPDTVVVTPEFINDDFFRVYQVVDSKQKDLGKPYDGIWCEYVAIFNYFKLKTKETGGLQCPWVSLEGEATRPFCVSNRRNFLQQGDYFTQIKLDFHYNTNSKERNIKAIVLKINFQIK
ncbi:MAG: hypothetical protein A2066_19145 [Bacteroidetes bacterium GWB2_41_8]|nr:MAG: hypothetical protein A2066_19145 [Bacteroidetes bacterium GWB2_41_8]